MRNNQALPKIIIRPEVYEEVMYYVKSTNIEVSGLGRVIQHDDGTIEVVKAYLLKQVGSGAETDLCPEAVADLQYTSRNDEGELLWWWHSHPTFGVFFSGTDDTTIKQIGKRGCFYGTVFNHKEELFSAYYQGANHGLPSIFLKDLETKVSSRASKSKTAEWKANFEKNVKKYVPKPIRNSLWTPTWETPVDKAIRKGVSHDFLDHEGIPLGNKKTHPNHNRRRNNGKYEADVETAGQRARLSGYSENEYAMLLEQYIKNAVDYSIWTETYCDMEEITLEDMSYRALWDFYELFDGDLSEAQAMLISEYAERDVPTETILGGAE